MTIKRVSKLFSKGNVCVCGLKGTGKDVLMGNVIARRNKPYASNLVYLPELHTNLDFKDMKMGGTIYKDLIEGKPKHYDCPYCEGQDVYISDAGIYLPAQYCNELNRDYKELPTFFALQRQLNDGRTHTNCQHLGRVWDKIREQSDTYIRCRYCYVIFGFVIQGITIYDKYESALNRVKPCRISVPLMANEIAKQSAKQYLDNFYNMHGTVKNHLLIYKNKSQHDTLYFREVFANAQKCT